MIRDGNSPSAGTFEPREDPSEVPANSIRTRKSLITVNESIPEIGPNPHAHEDSSRKMFPPGIICNSVASIGCSRREGRKFTTLIVNFISAVPRIGGVIDRNVTLNGTATLRVVMPVVGVVANRAITTRLRIFTHILRGYKYTREKPPNRTSVRSFVASAAGVVSGIHETTRNFTEL